jgi:peptidoglycan/xylan/chitin deacetylase (PgdA/CDA1 family)
MMNSAWVLLLLVLLGLPSAQGGGKKAPPDTYSSFNPGGQYIMLTFSGGPHHFITPRLLDILKEKKARATFFVTGSRALQREYYLKRIHSEGHEIGSEGFKRKPFTKLRPDQVLEHVQATSALVGNATGSVVRAVRPPGGLTNPTLNALLNSQYKVVLWSLDSKDSSLTDPAAVSKAVVDHAKPGDVVLLHDTCNVTIAALPGILDALHAKGYEFLTLAQVMSFPDDSPKG